MEEKKSEGRQARPQKTAARRLVKTLSSVKLAVSLLVLIAVVMIVATLLKNQAHARRYIYHSWWFVSLLGLFCLNLIFCTVGRWSLRLRRLGTTVTHVGVLVMVAGAVISSIWAQRGFIPLPIGQSSKLCYDDKQRPIQLPFEVHLDDFKVERHASQKEALVVHLVKEKTARVFPIRVGEEFEVGSGPYKITILRYEPDFVVLSKGDYGSRSKSPNNPAILVRVSGGSQDRTEWVFLKFPGMHRDPNADIVLDYRQIGAPGRVKDFKSSLRLLQDGQVVASKTIEVNKPLKYAGWAIYQSSYDSIHESWSGLEIAKDPGIPLVYLGFLLITIGVLYGFYLRPLVVKKSTAPAGARAPKT
ncbi:MAG: cytochrome c biogenesis protein ResB [bacterium]|nr:cytochrome c biogenesis protein ResB [bacterium]